MYGWVHTSILCMLLCACACAGLCMMWTCVHVCVCVCVCVCVFVFVKCLGTLPWMSECMCDMVLPECHTENWVWFVLQAKPHAAFSLISQMGKNRSRCNGSILGFLCSPRAFMFLNPAAFLPSFMQTKILNMVMLPQVVMDLDKLI